MSEEDGGGCACGCLGCLAALLAASLLLWGVVAVWRQILGG
jgi:hypothetical protein